MEGRSELAEGLRHLRARRFEEAEHALSSALERAPTAEAFLLRSAAREKLGRRAEARDDLVSAVIAPGGDVEPVIERAATRLVQLGAIHAAMDVLDGALARRPSDVRLVRLKTKLCLAVGRVREGLGSMRVLAADDAREVATLAHWLLGVGDAEQALEVTERAPQDSANLRVRLEAHCALGQNDRARALLAASGEGDAPLADARVAIRIGDFADAERRLTALTSRDPRNAEAWSLLADLALWKGDVEGALGAVERVASLEPDGARWHRQLGIAHALAGRTADALAAFDAALDLAPRDPEALLWRGELRRAQRDFDGSLADIDAGITASHGYPIAGHLSRLLTAAAGHGQEEGPLGSLKDEDLVELLDLLAPLLASPPRLSEPRIEDLEAALALMRGNRTTRPTFVANGRPEPLDMPIHVRFAAPNIQHRILTRSAADVVDELRALAVERPDAPTIHCHVGEVQLWLGDADAAEAAFSRSIRDTPKVRWAYVGLCAAEMIRGRWSEAIAWCDRGLEAVPPPGRTMFAYRGEVYRRAGDLERAEADLRHMLELTPGRISSWMNLALVRAARADHALLLPTLARLRRRAPGLVDDGCRELGIDALGSHDASAVVRVFEHLLAMMRGNRSSGFVTYFTAQGDLRFALQD
jgi:tetratricopeptide (TPR) repeat protein